MATGVGASAKALHRGTTLMRRKPGSPAGPRMRIHRHCAPASSIGPSASFSWLVETASESRMQKGTSISWSTARFRSRAASAVEATVALPA
eukprot:14502616-Alexandrium_andersonii.AAC.1